MTLEAQGIGYAIQGRWLVEDVDLRLPEGRLVALIGPNGSGKSTVLKLLSGDLTPTSGRVRFGGRPLPAWSPADLACHRAVVTQRSTAPFRYTARDVIMLGRLPHRGRRPAAGSGSLAAIADRLLAELDLAGFGDRFASTLSGGELQRVHFARAQFQLMGAAAPRALLLDEPTSALDLLHQHTLMHRCRRLADEGVAVLAVLHDLNLAARYADDVILLGAGRAAAVGAPQEVLTPKWLEAVYRIPVAVDATEDGRPYVRAAASRLQEVLDERVTDTPS